MQKFRQVIPAYNLLCLIMLSACSTSGKTNAPITLTVPPLPTTAQARVLPTASSRQDSIIWQDLKVTMDQVEITDEFTTEYDSTRSPSAGEKFFWVHVQLKNEGEKESELPSFDHFSVLYAATELKPNYGHRMGFPEYSSLAPTLFPNQELEGWIRFDIPAEAELKDLRFVYLPESSHVGSSFSSPIYPYAEDKPAFVWTCMP